MSSAEDVILIATGVTLGYFFVAEIYKVVKNKDWILLAIILSILAVVIWIFYKAWTAEDKEPDKKPVAEPNPPLEEDEPFQEVPEEFQSVKQDFTFGLPTPVVDNQMNYTRFKELYLTPDFLEKFTQSTRLSLQIKKKRYWELRDQFNLELRAFQRGKKESLAEVFSNRKNEMIESIKSAIRQIDEILPEIEQRLKTLTVEQSKKHLQKAFNHPKDGLETLTGREEVKDFLALRLYTFAMNPRIFFTKFQNVPLYAGSGYGKTKIAKVIGHVYTASGILIRGHFIQTTKAGLVSPYVNETAHNTRVVLLSTLESVLFIDEAYDITPPKNILGQGLDHGHEAITELVNFIDKMIGLSIIIVAGYEDQMEEQFMKANEGLERRFLPPIVLKPYTSKQLTTILIRFLQETNPDIHLSQEHCDYIYSLVDWINKEDEEIFSKQAGAALILAGEISYAIYGTPGAWPNEYQKLIRNGFNKFLAPKGLSVLETSLT